ncbi:MAG: outer membrane beta-barrel protein [Planctomycetes bacterium]|nr:outer membrane beta-barrel protein [Planctomycetota bacterium]
MTVPSDDVPEMEYTYVEANFLWTDSDDIDETLTGGEFTGSLELPLNFFAQLTLSRQSDDADLDTFRLGAGYHLPLGSRFDAYGLLSLAHLEVDGTANDFDDDGLAAEIGVRLLLTPKLEVNGKVEWADVGDENYGVGIGARYYLMDSISLGGRVEAVDGDESIALGLRLEL